ncbi:MAG: nucleotidyltransferase family protein [Tatlockia sp.]|jgi:NDP-sugar pyrophosphorylase family protein
MCLPLAILSGGLATRLRPLTDKTPKSLIKVGGDYFIHHQLRHLRAEGITKVVLCVGYLGEQIQALVGDGTAFDLEIHYSFDGESPLGTGGAIKKAAPLLGSAFFVLYGDSYLPIAFQQVAAHFHQSPQKALMTVFKNNNQGDKSNVEFRDGRIIEYNKHAPKASMHYIDYGLSILSQSALEGLPENTPFDLASLFSDLSWRGELAGFEVFERFYEIGSFAGLNEAQKRFLGLESGNSLS